MHRPPQQVGVGSDSMEPASPGVQASKPFLILLPISRIDSRRIWKVVHPHLSKTPRFAQSRERMKLKKYFSSVLISVHHEAEISCFRKKSPAGSILSATESYERCVSVPGQEPRSLRKFVLQISGCLLKFGVPGSFAPSFCDAGASSVFRDFSLNPEFVNTFF